MTRETPAHLPMRFALTPNMREELILSLNADLGYEGIEGLTGEDEWKRCLHRYKTRLAVETPAELHALEAAVDDVYDRSLDWETPALTAGLRRLSREITDARDAYLRVSATIYAEIAAEMGGPSCTLDDLDAYAVAQAEDYAGRNGKSWPPVPQRDLASQIIGAYLDLEGSRV